MGRNKQPLELVVAKGKTHLTKEEKEKREKTEVKPVNSDVVAPSYLTKKQKEEFDEIARQLKALKILNETDTDAIARYVVSRELWVSVTKQLQKKDIINDPYAFEKILKNQDRLFKQCRASASDLGLTITSRCKLVVPEGATPPPANNKFNKFTAV